MSDVCPRAANPDRSGCSRISVGNDGLASVPDIVLQLGKHEVGDIQARNFAHPPDCAVASHMDGAGDIFGQALRDSAGWQMTDAGQAFVVSIESSLSE
jgi:hypothetical protein